MRFDINDYPKGSFVYAMNCDTVEKAHIFLEYLHTIGRNWLGGDSYTSEKSYDRFNKHKEHTCFYFNDGQYGELNYALSDGVTVLYFDDFDWGEDETPRLSFQEFLSGAVNQTTI